MNSIIGTARSAASARLDRDVERETSTEDVCPYCQSPNFSLWRKGVSASGPNTEYRCDECKRPFWQDEIRKINWINEAVILADDPDYATLRREHFDALYEHTLLLYLRLAETESQLAEDRARLTSAQRVVDECAALTRRIA